MVGIIDSNSSPEGIDFPVPGNDDSLRAITLYCDLIAGSVLSGIQQEISDSGGDIGASVDSPEEELPVAGAASANVDAATVGTKEIPDEEMDGIAAPELPSADQPKA